MDIYKSKELAEKLSGKEAVLEAIEGIVLTKEDLPEEVSMFLEAKEQEYMVYVNPLEEEKTIAHVLTENEEVLLSFLVNEEGEVEKVYGIEGMEQGSHLGS